MAQLSVRGFKPYIMRRLASFSLFWHALDIVWGCRIHRRLSTRINVMNDLQPSNVPDDTAPGEESDSFISGFQTLRHRPGIGVGVHRDVVLGSRIRRYCGRPASRSGCVCSRSPRWACIWSFFLHITTGPDNTNNVLALGVRYPDRISDCCRIALDHDESQPQHVANGPAYEDAALTGLGGCLMLCCSKRVDHRLSLCRDVSFDVLAPLGSRPAAYFVGQNAPVCSHAPTSAPACFCVPGAGRAAETRRPGPTDPACRPRCDARDPRSLRPPLRMGSL